MVFSETLAGEMVAGETVAGETVAGDTVAGDTARRDEALAEAAGAVSEPDSAALLQLCRAAAAADVERVPGGGLLRRLSELCEAASAVQAATARVIERVEREDLAVQDCGLRTAGWIAREVRRPASACRRQVTRARTAVHHFDEFVDAVADGRVGWEHVELVVAVSNARNRERLASVQDELIAAACSMGWPHWAALVRRVAEEADEDGGYDPGADVHANRLRMSVLPDGTTEVSGRLVGEWAFVVDGTIDAIADELFRTYTRDHEVDPDVAVPDRVTLRALALAEACRRARATELDSSAPSRPEAVVVIEHDPHSDTHRVRDLRNRLLPEAVVGALLADADCRALVTDADRNPLSLGRRRRLVSREQRLALSVRDGGCVFPGCDAPPGWSDAHHVRHWRDGGRTDTDNLALLCRHHHGLTHRSGWRMRRCADVVAATGGGCGRDVGGEGRADGHGRGSLFEWVTPAGRRLRSEHRQAPPV